MGGQHFSARDIFQQFFGTSDPFAAGSHDEESGGMGGFPGMSSGMGGMSGGVRGFPGMPSMNGTRGMSGVPSSSARQARKAEAIVYPLQVTLEDVYTGITKRVRISKTITHDNGRQEKQSVDKSIPIKKGWKDGTKITFEREGDQAPGIIPADIIFELKIKPHAHFTRVDGDDLEHTCDVELREVLGNDGIHRYITTLAGTRMPLALKRFPESGRCMVRGEGMPSQKTGKHGNLIINFKIKMPRNLTEDEKGRVCNILDAAAAR